MEEKYIKAIEAKNNAYARYSKFHVGACLVLKDGKFIIGSNIENSSYGLCNCAERSALFAAYSNGYRQNDILELVICTDNLEPASPCGACRQVINDLMLPNAKVTLINPQLKNTKEYLVKDLLPFAFTPEDLENE